MAKIVKIEVNKGPLTALQDLFKAMLKSGEIKAVLVPMFLPMKNVVMPSLVTDPDQLDRTDPLAPSFSMNSAKLVSRLTRKHLGEKVAVVLRSCEIRAFIELVKLKQGNADNLIIVSLDCLGAYSNVDYARFVGDNAEDSTKLYYENVLSGKGPAINGVEAASACRICVQPISEIADISIGLFGVDIDKELVIQSTSDKGDDLVTALKLTETEKPAKRQEVIDSLINARQAELDKVIADTAEEVGSIEKLNQYLAACVNCYNCRVACPVCYCKECVFVTDVFDHEPHQYLNWAERKGGIKMPTDTVFFHITRIAHMSLSCVGCGQCSNACPNDIPLTELFRTLANSTQQSFKYMAGRSLDEKPPLSEFKENEYQDIVGINAG